MMEPKDATRRQRRWLAEENKRWPKVLAQVPPDQWPPSFRLMQKPPIEVFRSCDFLVQCYSEKEVILRMSVCRTSIEGERWTDGISWDDLQRLKREIGCGDYDAVEVFPADKDIVNVANMRHLWVLPSNELWFAWRKK